MLCEQQEDLSSITDIAVKSYCFQFSLDINLIRNFRGGCVSCEQKAKQKQSAQPEPGSSNLSKEHS
jgi:hypothetical protein